MFNGDSLQISVYLKSLQIVCCELEGASKQAWCRGNIISTWAELFWIKRLHYKLNMLTVAFRSLMAMISLAVNVD